MKRVLKGQHLLGLCGAVLSVAVIVGAARAQSGGSEAYLNSLDLSFSQYNQRMGLSLWEFNQNMAQAGMGSSRDILARGTVRIKGGKADVTYRPLAPTLAADFAASRSSDAAKRQELIQTYNQYLGRFRDAQRKDRLGEHDVAASLALAFASYYEIYSNGPAATPAQERDLVEQFRQSLMKNPYFQGANDHYRQLLDENSAVQTVASLVLDKTNAKRLGFIRNPYRNEGSNSMAANLDRSANREALLSLAMIRSEELSAAGRDENWFYRMLMSMGEAIIATNEAGEIVFINPLAERLTGWTRAEALGQDIATVYRAIDPLTGEVVPRFLVDVARGSDVMAVKVEMELVARDGSHIAVDDTASPVHDASGRAAGVVVVFRDTTSERDARRKVEEFNQRLRQAMAETNHRVKNNLQVIAALEDLQDEQSDGALPTAAKQKLSMHIQTLAQLHDFLTEEAKTSEDFTFVSAHETLAKLVPMVQATVVHRLVSFTGDSVRLPTQQSSSLALIANELINNALKHGRGAVEINLIRENGTCRVEVLDDGSGFPEGFDVRTSAHNGLMLVLGLAKTDLKGNVVCNNRPEGGGRVSVQFPVKP